MNIDAAVPPVANFGGTSDYDGTAATDILIGSASDDLGVGQAFRVILVVELDPDHANAVYNAAGELENSADVTGLGENGNTATDVSDDTADSTDAQDPSDVDNDGDDPTAFVLSDIELQKTAVSTVPASSGTANNFDITYEFVVTNTGNDTLSNLTLTDDWAGQFGNMFVQIVDADLSNGDVTAPAGSGINGTTSYAAGATDNLLNGLGTLATGESVTVTLIVEVDPDADPTFLVNGTLENTATISATDSSNNPISDVSDDPTDADDTETEGDNDPDSATNVSFADINLTKNISGSPVPSESGTSGNFDVTYEFVVTNTGSEALSNLSLTDDLAGQLGGAFVDVVSVEVVNIDSTVPPLANAVTSTGGYNGSATSDILLGSTADEVLVGQSFRVLLVVEVDPDNASATYNASGELENSADVSGVGENNGTATDVSDSNGGPDANDPSDVDNDGDDPTAFIISGIQLTKTAVSTVPASSGISDNYDITYEFVVTNTGSEPLTNLELTDNWTAQFGNMFVRVVDSDLSDDATVPAGSGIGGAALYLGNPTQNILNGLGTLNAGDSVTVTLVVEVNPDADPGFIVDGSLQNSAVVTGTDSNNISVSDISDDPADADDSDVEGDNDGDSPSNVVIPDIGVAKVAGDAVQNGDRWDVTFTVRVANIGTVPLSDLSLIDDIENEFGNAFFSVSGLTVQNFNGAGTPPIANTAWESDTELSLVTGGLIHAGDSFDVVFTATIDPDGIDSMSQALTNQVTSTGSATNADGTLILDDSGNPITTSDDSDNGTDPQSENGEQVTADGISNNDPTPILIADIGIAKGIVGTPQLLNNDNYSVTYQLVVENTGTVNLSGVSLVEDLQAEFGTSLVGVSGLILSTAPNDSFSNIVVNNANWDGDNVTELLNTTNSTLAIGDSFVVQFNAEVDPDAIGAPDDLDNQVTANGIGVDENGDTITDSNNNPLVATDLSDSGTDPNGANDGNDTNTGGTDDPTRLYLPSVGVAKQAGFAVPNADNPEHLDVTFTLTWQNTGSAVLTNLTLVDDIASEFGSQFAGVSGLTVGNFSGTGVPPTANGSWESNTALNLLVGGTANQGDSFEVSFVVTLSPNADGSFDSLTNQAVGTGDALDDNGNPIFDDNGNPFGATDLSDDGVDPTGENTSDNSDGVPHNDPTPVQFADLGIAKSVVDVSDVTFNGHAIVTFQLVVENTGTLDLDNLSLVESLVGHFGSAYVDAGNLVLTSLPNDADSSITLNSSGWNGRNVLQMLDTSVNNSLAVGDSFTAEFTVEINALEITDTLVNQVTGTGNALDENGNAILDSNGNPLQTVDVSDNGLDPNSENGEDDTDGIFGNDPTPVDIEIDPTGYFYDADTGQILTDGFISVTGPNPGSVILTDAGEDGDYQFFGTEAGTYTLRITAPPGYTLDRSALQSSFFDPSGLGNPVVLGASDADGNGELDGGVSVTDYYIRFDLEPGDPLIINNNLPFRRITPSGTSGNPPNLPGFAPLYSNPIGSALNGYTGSPGPIYSGREVIGGYSGSGGAGLPVADTNQSSGEDGNLLTSNGHRRIDVGHGCGPRSVHPADNLAWSIDRQDDERLAQEFKRQFVITLDGDVKARQSASVHLNLDDDSRDRGLKMDEDFVERILSAVESYEGPGQLTFDGQRLTYTSDQSGSEMAPLLVDLPIVEGELENGLEDVSIILDEPQNSTIDRDGENPELLEPPIPEEADGEIPTSSLDVPPPKSSFLKRFRSWLS